MEKNYSEYMKKMDDYLELLGYKDDIYRSPLACRDFNTPIYAKGAVIYQGHIHIREKETDELIVKNIMPFYKDDILLLGECIVYLITEQKEYVHSVYTKAFSVEGFKPDEDKYAEHKRFITGLVYNEKEDAQIVESAHYSGKNPCDFNMMPDEIFLSNALLNKDILLYTERSRDTYPKVAAIYVLLGFDLLELSDKSYIPSDFSYRPENKNVYWRYDTYGGLYDPLSCKHREEYEEPDRDFDAENFSVSDIKDVIKENGGIYTEVSYRGQVDLSEVDKASVFIDGENREIVPEREFTKGLLRHEVYFEGAYNRAFLTGACKKNIVSPFPDKFYFVIYHKNNLSSTNLKDCVKKVEFKDLTLTDVYYKYDDESDSIIQVIIFRNVSWEKTGRRYLTCLCKGITYPITASMKYRTFSGTAYLYREDPDDLTVKTYCIFKELLIKWDATLAKIASASKDVPASIPEMMADPFELRSVKALYKVEPDEFIHEKLERRRLNVNTSHKEKLV